MEKIMLSFGQRLKMLRKEKKMTQVEMAELLDYTGRHYQKVEAGEVNVPGLTLMKLADFFDVTLDYLVGRTDQR